MQRVFLCNFEQSELSHHLLLAFYLLRIKREKLKVKFETADVS